MSSVVPRACGSYNAMEGGTGGEALEDFTGGVTEVVASSDYGYQDDEVRQKNFFKVVLRAHQTGSLMCTGIPVRHLGTYHDSTSG